jgi:hypothetical protein
MPKIKVNRTFKSLKIYINKILHLELRIKNHDGVQSWFEGDNNKMYYIEFYRIKGEPILLEYNDIKVWKLMLEIIDKNI